MKKIIAWPGWETVRLIGRGSFGSVYEIQRTIGSHISRAALKVIRIPQDDSEIAELRAEGYDDKSLAAYFADSRQKIEREYAMMADMKGHPNVVYCDDIHAVPHDSSFGWDIYIKMELLTPLKNYLTDAISEEQVIKLGQDLCSALVLCQRNNVVHRDIKPENIFVARDGSFKLGDFGIAKTMDGTTGGTKTGTYDNMAPEVFNNQPYHMQADLYSLGLVMYWMLNERTAPFLPISMTKPTPSMKKAARERRFSGEAIPEPKHGSNALKRIILKACSVDPKDRYASAVQMLEDLNGLESARILPADMDVNTEYSIEGERTVGPRFPAWDDSADDDKTMGPTLGKVQESGSVPPNAPKKRIALIVGICTAVTILIAMLFFVGSRGDVRGETQLPTLNNSTIPNPEKCEVIADSDRIMVGQTTCVAFVVDEYTYRSEDALDWSSSDTDVAEVSSDGTVTGVSAGTAVITGSLDGRQASAVISVEAGEQPVTEAGAEDETVTVSASEWIQVNLRTPHLLVGDTMDAWLSTDGWHLDGESEGIEWSVDDPSVAVVDNQGRVTALRTGTCHITAVYQGLTDSQELTVVTVDSNSGAVVTADYNKLSLRAGNSDTVNITFSGDLPEQIGATAYYSVGLQASLKWGTLMGDTVPLEIQVLYADTAEGCVTILVYDQNDPGHIVASTKLQIKIN